MFEKIKEAIKALKQEQPTRQVDELLGRVEVTERGFEIIEFTDRYNKKCQLQQSSLAEFELPGSSAVWLGIENERMHLDVEQVKKLINTLNQWIETASFKKEA